jgi:hypothetical protein
MNVATVSTDWVGEEPCWEAGEMEELDVVEGGMTTRSVLTWCESALRVWRDSHAMVEVAGAADE